MVTSVNAIKTFVNTTWKYECIKQPLLPLRIRKNCVLSLFVHRKLILVLAEWPSNIQSGRRIILSARAIFRPPFVVLGEQSGKGPEDKRQLQRQRTYLPTNILQLGQHTNTVRM
jgi:hypothetical protein